MAVYVTTTAQLVTFALPLESVWINNTNNPTTGQKVIGSVPVGGSGNFSQITV